MPTIIFLFGWRIFFYADEGNEPLHVHCQKAEMEAKFWLDSDTRAITVVFAHKMKPKDMREVRGIISTHFAVIERAWAELARRTDES